MSCGEIRVRDKDFCCDEYEIHLVLVDSFRLHNRLLNLNVFQVNFYLENLLIELFNLIASLRRDRISFCCNSTSYRELVLLTIHAMIIDFIRFNVVFAHYAKDLFARETTCRCSCYNLRLHRVLFIPMLLINSWRVMLLCLSMLEARCSRRVLLILRILVVELIRFVLFSFFELFGLDWKDVVLLVGMFFVEWELCVGRNSSFETRRCRDSLGECRSPS